jgi:hypothetical protein
LVTHMDDVKSKGGIVKLKQMRADVRNLCDSDKEIYEQVLPTRFVTYIGCGIFTS